MSDEELEELRRRRMAELQGAAEEERRRAQLRRRLEEEKQALLFQILSPEARQRLTNIKMVRPEFAAQLELQLIQLAQSGRVKIPITDQQLNEALKSLQSLKRDIMIRRI
ncbi:MAG: DNA-binding protein [Candidatus Bathyarchaeia archaeon]